MKRKMGLGIVAAACAAVVSVAGLADAAPFTAGNLAVYRVGDGGTALTNAATAVFLDEYTPAGALVQSLALQTMAAAGGNRAITASGTATSEGQIRRSPDGQYLAVTGYNANTGTAAVASSTVARVVGIVGADGSVDSTTALTGAFSGNNIRGAVTTNGTDLWVAGAGSTSTGGVHYTTVGSSTTTQLTTTTTNIRAVDIFGGQLYVGSSSGSTRVATAGTGLPTAGGQAIANLPGTAGLGSPYAFFLADLSQDVDGFDTLYVADDGTGTGLMKFSLVGGIWASNGNVAVTGNGLRGLTGSVAPTTGAVTLYGTTAGAIYSLVDTAGYNAAPGASLTSIATAGTNTAFRGIDFAPAAVPEPSTACAAIGAIGILAGSRRRQ